MLYVNPITAAPPAPGGSQTGATGQPREHQAMVELERLFLFEMVRAMRRTLPGDALFGDSAPKRFFEEMLDDALCGSWAESGTTGIARAMERQFHETDPRGNAALNFSVDRVDNAYSVSDPVRTGAYAWTL
ncbi:MAG TPA: rod-binding protein [Candidatus Hydrogenedentes bacterium]|nr:rod-binding protein [Candidatus Hydrogenedentota bacterium]